MRRLGWIVWLLGLSVAVAGQETVLVEAELALYPGSRAALAVTVDVLEGWYIQEHKPVMAELIPTVVTVEPAEGLVFGAVRYPPPEKKYLTFARRELGVYSGTVTFTVPVEVDKNAAPGLRLVKVLVQYQSCSDRYCLLPEVAERVIPVRVLPPEPAAQGDARVQVWGPLALGGGVLIWATTRRSSSRRRRFQDRPGP